MWRYSERSRLTVKNGLSSQGYARRVVSGPAKTAGVASRKEFTTSNSGSTVILCSSSAVGTLYNPDWHLRIDTVECDLVIDGLNLHSGSSNGHEDKRFQD